MLKNFITSILALTVFTMSFSPIAFAQAADDKEAQRQRDVEIFVNKLGVGEKSRVKVKLKDNKKSVKGYIREINDETFVLTDKKKNTTAVQYSNVKKVSRDELGTVAKIGIGIGVLFGAVAICFAAGGCVD
ncbi:MAG: hypothetical protein ACKVQW_04455 [Pyrinomonadaceae bacterium]